MHIVSRKEKARTKSQRIERYTFSKKERRINCGNHNAIMLPVVSVARKNRYCSIFKMAAVYDVFYTNVITIIACFVSKLHVFDAIWKDFEYHYSRIPDVGHWMPVKYSFQQGDVLSFYFYIYGI